MYSTYNKGKSAVAEIVIEPLKEFFLSIWQLYEKNFILMF